MSENFSPADMAAVMNNNGNCNNWMNNPFMYLIWLAYMGGGNGLFGRNGVQDAEVQGRLNALSQQIADNQSTNTLNTAINSNHDYLHGMSNSVNMGFAGTNAAINNGVQTGIIGNKDLQAAIQTCCCNNQTAILNQTNQLQTQIEGTRQAIVNGFAQLGYAQAQQTNELNTNATANTQRIIDQMCANTTQDLRDKVAEYSQKAQTADIVAQLKSGCGC